MKLYRVRFNAAAVADLAAIFDFIADNASVGVAEGFVVRLEAA